MQLDPTHYESSHVTTRKRVVWLKFRWLVALLGFGLLVAGQVYFASLQPSDLPITPIETWLTEKIYLGDARIGNVLHGVPMMLVGGLLLAIAFYGVRLLPTESMDFEQGDFSKITIASVWGVLFAGAVFFAFLMFRIADEAFRPFQVPFWLLSITLFGLGILISDKQHWGNLSPNLLRKDWVWIFLLLLFGFLIGTYRLMGMPDQLVGDEGNFWTIARDIALGEFNPSVFLPGVYTFPVFSSMLQAWVMKLFGISLWGWRFSSVFFGVATILPLYLFVREAFNRKMAVISSFVLITSPYFIAFSRLGYNNIQAIFFTTLAAYWLYMGLVRRSNTYIYLTGIAAGLGFYTYFAARLFIILALGFVLLMWLMKRVRFSDLVQVIGVLFIGFILVVVPLLVYGYINDPIGMSYKVFESVFFNTFNGLMFFPEEELFSVAPPFTLYDNELFYNPQIYFVLIIRGVIRTLLVFQKPGIISEHFIAFPLTGTMGALFYVTGIVLAFRTIKNPRSLLLLFLFFTNVIGLSALNTVPPRQTHMVTIIPVLALLTGMGIYALAEGISVMHFRLRKLRIPIMTLLVSLVIIGGIYDYFFEMPKQYPPSWDQVISWAVLDVHEEKITYIYEDASQEEFYPYIGAEFRKTDAYETISAEEVLEGRKVFLDEPRLIFFPPQLSDRITPILDEQWEDQFVVRTFYGGDNIPILAVAMNTPFIFERDKSFFTVLRESYQYGSAWILFLVLVIGLSFAIFLPEGWSTKFAAPVQRLLGWFSAPGRFDRMEEDLSDDTEELLLANQEIFSVDPVDETADEPPVWVSDPIFEKQSVGNSDRVSLMFKPVKTDTGTDYYLKLHFPRFFSGIFKHFRKPDSGDLPGFFFMPAFQIPGSIRFAASIVLVIIAQLFVSNRQFNIGLVFFMAGAVGLIFWFRQYQKWNPIFTRQVNLLPRAELILVILLIVLVVATRFLDLGDRVYGLEADETKWTVQSWYSTILMQDIGEFSGMHYKPLPVDFWVRSVFLRIFGINFLSARIESAVLSLVSVLFLYLLVRQITSSGSVALLSALLFSMSFIELNASHQALHNTPPMPWALGSLYFFFKGLRERKFWQFQGTGIVLALGMLTYETFFPTVAVVLIYLLGFSVFEVIKGRSSVKAWLLALLLVSWPVLLVYLVFTRDYLAGRHDYLFGAFYGATQPGEALLGMLAYFWGNFREVVETTFVQVLWTDSLINWTGPLINPFLLPFIVIGFVYNAWNVRRPHFSFILLWYSLNILSAPILLASILPRVMYLAVPPLMIWGALGIWISFGALRGLLDRSHPHLVRTVFLVLLFAIVLNDYQIFTRRLIDPEDRQKRRELADQVAASAASEPLVLLPYIPNHNDSVELESHVLLYSVAGARDLGLDASQYYRLTEYDNLLGDLWSYKDLSGIDIIYDKTSGIFQEDRQSVLDIVLKCYPGALLQQTGEFFDVYRLDAGALETPKCYLPVAPVGIEPSRLITSPVVPVVFRWDTSGSDPTSFKFILERKRDDVEWIEVEDVFEGPGWSMLAGIVDEYTGEGFLIDSWQSDEAVYIYNTPKAGDYRIWIRSYKRRENDQHNFVTVGERTFEFAENGNPLDEWYWQDLGVINLDRGESPFVLTRSYGQDEQYSVFIDSLVISSDMEFDPREMQIWGVELDTPEMPLSINQYALTEELSVGEYRWRVRIFNGDQIVDTTGARGVDSVPIMFEVVR